MKLFSLLNPIFETSVQLHPAIPTCTYITGTYVLPS